MLDDDDENANLPAEGAIPVAGEGWPGSAGGADIAPPPYFSPPPGANAEQRRMFDMLNARGMQMYRQVLQDRRSAANQRAIADRQYTNQMAIEDRRAATQKATDDRQRESLLAAEDRRAATQKATDDRQRETEAKIGRAHV